MRDSVGEVAALLRFDAGLVAAPSVGDIRELALFVNEQAAHEAPVTLRVEDQPPVHHGVVVGVDGVAVIYRVIPKIELVSTLALPVLRLGDRRSTRWCDKLHAMLLASSEEHHENNGPHGNSLAHKQPELAVYDLE